ncbi:hypothetical protein MTF65_18970 [Streptomyces sp. APSN-46.1]|uniref:hypothetical protein n=1 Tax=Streptomyces sp. APSN-46.1 TaxID=2929049 RepID=UPI001FB480BE|nr:hypothetical protein [Streptomyces sp. APSN-46.1]MCJ1679383.1 hypothetical protein [Streptomyces sp. APSN-46.1]
MSDPLSRTMLLVDTERFSDRDDVQQTYLRRMLYGVVDRTLLAAGIDQTLRLRADRGDAIMELIDPVAPLTTLLRALLTEVPAQLRAVNRMAASSAQIRLRAVLATGYVAIDEYDGWVGTDLNQACRLLDGDPLRAALRERTDDYALCVSEAVYSGIVRHNHTGIPAEEFHGITMPSKNGPLQAWLYGPPPSGLPAPRPVPTASAAPTPPVSPPAGSGIQFHGVNNGVVADRIRGNISIGGGPARPGEQA